MKQAARATASGHWPLLRFDPSMRRRGMNPFRLDSPAPAHHARGVSQPRGALQGGRTDQPRRSAPHAAAGAARGGGTLQALRGPGRARRQPVPTALGERMSTDLSTTYLGLPLSEPDHRLRIAVDLDGGRHTRHRGRRRGRGRDALALRGTDLRRGHRLCDVHRPRLLQPVRGRQLLSAPARLRQRRVGAPRYAATRGRRGRHPGHRQPERGDPGGLDRTTP